MEIHIQTNTNGNKQQIVSIEIAVVEWLRVEL